MAALILVREAFFLATSGSFTTQNKEIIWYPLSALTEYASLAVFSIPGLLPTRAQLKAAEEAKKVIADSAAPNGLPMYKTGTYTPYANGSAYADGYAYAGGSTYTNGSTYVNGPAYANGPVQAQERPYVSPRI
jgi:hypothetical protein